MMTSYLLLMIYLTNGIQALQHRLKKCVDRKEDYVKNEPLLVIFDEAFFFNLSIFQSIIVC